jgi:hypothetical protein
MAVTPPTEVNKTVEKLPGAAGGSATGVTTTAPAPGWTNLFDREHLDGWFKYDVNPLKPGFDGTVQIRNSIYDWGSPVRDAIIRAKVRKINGKNLALLLRGDKTGHYVAWFDGDKKFGIRVWRGKEHMELSEVQCKQRFPDFFVMEFSAIGDQLILTANGEEISRVHDQIRQMGTVGISVIGNSLFRDVQVKVLDKDASPRAGTTATRLALEWTNLLDREHLDGWSKIDVNRLKPGFDGTVQIRNSIYDWGSPVRDAIIRAKVRMIDGECLALLLRGDKTGHYVAWFDGDKKFGIRVWRGKQTMKLSEVQCKHSFPDFFVMEFSAIGDQLILTANGEEILRIHDQLRQMGSVGIKAVRGNSLFRDVQVKVLDKDTPHTATGGGQ